MHPDGCTSIAPVSPDAHSPAERADAVLRAAEAAAAAAQAAAAAAQAASLPPAPDEPPAPASEAPADVVPAHEVGAPERLLAAAGDLEALVAQARAQLDALEDALARLEGPVEPAQ